MTARAASWCRALAALASVAAVLVPPFAFADVFRPAYLELRELGGERYDVLLKVPSQGGQLRLALDVRFPEGTVEVEPRRSQFVADGYTERWRIERPGGLVGAPVEIVGRAAGVTDVLARVERLDGTSQVDSLTPGRAAFIVEPSLGLAQTAVTYLVLGVEHILGGVDHLLFVLSLLLIVKGVKRLVVTITAFTLAHSLTLAAATLGFVHVPGPPVEAAIALSIVFVAAEVVRGLRGAAGLTSRAPWLVAFVFGLLHGFGFAAALAEVGLPQKAIPIALLTFNVGVELGQLAFVAAVVAVAAACARLPARLPRWSASVPPYAIGVVAMFWVAERVASF
ncbi:MAG TPA: HupE/UreJ family protein [Gammaproteobacteria bacterium]|nr:HupE/UreJ family protein [Gammaproteobacteria bacterium]